MKHHALKIIEVGRLFGTFDIWNGSLIIIKLMALLNIANHCLKSFRLLKKKIVVFLKD